MSAKAVNRRGTKSRTRKRNQIIMGTTLSSAGRTADTNARQNSRDVFDTPSETSVEEDRDSGFDFNMTDSSSTKSEKYVPTTELEEANTLYKKVQAAVTGMSRPSKRALLEKASILYTREIQKCSTLQDSFSAASIFKNKGNTNLRLAEIVDNLNPLKEFSEVIYFLSEGVQAFVNALRARPKDMTSEWGIGVEEKIQQCFLVGLSRGCSRDDLDEMAMTGKLMKLFEPIPMNNNFKPLRTKCYLLKSQKFHNNAIVSLESFDFRTALRFMEHAREDCAMAQKYSKGNAILVQETRILEQEVFMLKCRCESVRVRSQADSLFTEHITGSETVDFRVMWNIVDMYKEAVLLTRETDIENEALALSRLGRVYDKVLKMRVKAHDNYRKSFDLVQTLFPKDMSKVEWYLECKNALEKFQKNVVLEEQKRQEAEKAPVLEKLKPELLILKKFSEKELSKFIKFLYSKYPPKIKYEFKEDNLKDCQLHKQVLKEAISHYHPDRQVNFGIEWKVLCGEISKYLTALYENHK